MAQTVERIQFVVRKPWWWGLGWRFEISMLKVRRLFGWSPTEADLEARLERWKARISVEAI